MPSKKRPSKANQCFQKAIIALNRDNVSRRRAAAIARLPLSTFQYRLDHIHDNPKPRSVLTEEEENVIVELIKKYSAKGFPLCNEDVADAVQLLVNSLSVERQQNIPFVNNRPGKKFLKNFRDRHAADVSFKRSSKEEDLRWRCCNAETLTTHMTALQKLIEENNIGAECIANIDETGMSSNKDGLRSDKKKGYHTRGTRPEKRSPIFQNIEHLTMLIVVFADGSCGRPLFVLKGKQLKYQVVTNGVNENVETVANCLPVGALTFMRVEVGGVDSKNICRWAEQFEADCRHLTSSRRRVLLLMDGYRCHMPYRVMHFFSQHNIIVYALPSHTSGMTQPLDVGVFGPLKEHLRNLIDNISSPDTVPVYSLFDYLKLVRYVYSKAFTRSNIISGFGKSGVYPSNWKALIRSPRPLSFHEADTIISVEDISEMIDNKRALLRSGIGLQPVVIRRGFLDTTEGLCLTSEVALEKALQKDEWDKARKAESKKRETEKAEREAKLSEHVRKARLAFESRALSRRVILYGIPNVPPRPMKVRREVAKRLMAERALKRHGAANSISKT